MNIVNVHCQIYSCGAKLNFQHHYSSLQVSILQKSLQYVDLLLNMYYA